MTRGQRVRLVVAALWVCLLVTTVVAVLTLAAALVSWLLTPIGLVAALIFGTILKIVYDESKRTGTWCWRFVNRER